MCCCRAPICSRSCPKVGDWLVVGKDVGKHFLGKTFNAYMCTHIHSHTLNMIFIRSESSFKGCTNVQDSNPADSMAVSSCKMDTNHGHFPNDHDLARCMWLCGFSGIGFSSGTSNQCLSMNPAKCVCVCPFWYFLGTVCQLPDLLSMNHYLTADLCNAID